MFKFLKRNTELEDAEHEIIRLKRVINDQWVFYQTAERQREHWQLRAVELDVAHGLLWKAHAGVLEGVTDKPNGTVRKFLKIAEQALIDCPVSDVKPEPKWTL
jgi:hypothetical protein